MIGIMLAAARDAAAETAFTVPAGERQLFLDDAGVARISRLKRTMHRPEKRGAVIRPDKPWDNYMIQTRSAPVWDPGEGVYKMIYYANSTKHANPAMFLAVSKDGVNWEKPDLGLLAARGFESKHNNRISLPEERWGAGALCNVVYDPDDPNPARRYKGLMGKSGGRVPVVSPDCIRWETIEGADRPAGSDESTLTYDSRNKLFILMIKGYNEHGRASNIAFSEDFKTWTRPRFCFGADEEDQRLALTTIRRRLGDPGLAKPFCVDPDPALGWTRPEAHTENTWGAQLYNMAVFPYEGVYIGMPMMFYPVGWAQPLRNNTDGFQLLKLVMSRDLENWEWLGEREAFIGPSRLDKGLAGVFDRIQLAPVNEPILRGDELWFYYTGIKWRCEIYGYYTDGSKRDPDTLTPEQKNDLEDGMSAICLAVLRRDGFVSLDAGEATGSVTTRPFKLPGGNLFVNVDASGGEMLAEAVEESGEVLAVSEPMTGDLPRGEVRWRAGNFAALEGTPVRLRFTLRNAGIYSYWLR